MGILQELLSKPKKLILDTRLPTVVHDFKKYKHKLYGDIKNDSKLY